MKQITQFPRIPFAVLPTPLYKLEAISREYGKNIYIKRDDMIGVALGGNKVRKLEFLLADAHRRWPAVEPCHAHCRVCRKARYEGDSRPEKTGRADRRQPDS